MGGIGGINIKNMMEINITDLKKDEKDTEL